MRSPAVREPAVSGSFYPEDPSVLRDTVDALLSGAAPHPSLTPKALVVPHAGYVYSGPVAAVAYALAARMRDRITRAVIIGPTHRVALRGVALAGVEGFATPLGVLPVPESWAATRLSALPTASVNHEAHRWEHSVEVQMPFIQRALGTVDVIPVLAGDATSDEVADVLDALWGGPETLIIVSTDLSHYLPDHEARRADAATIARILALDGPIDHEYACGATALNGLLTAARRHGLHPTLLDARNSSDTAGDPDRVVGYCSIAFEEAPHG
jgi:MEMO1 family protein